MGQISVARPRHSPCASFGLAHPVTEYGGWYAHDFRGNFRRHGHKPEIIKKFCHDITAFNGFIPAKLHETLQLSCACVMGAVFRRPLKTIKSSKYPNKPAPFSCFGRLINRNKPAIIPKNMEIFL
jgi:hypothetical protein